MSGLPQTHGDRRRFPVFALVILAGALASYTVVRLQGLSGRLPYDPGPPHPTVELHSDDAVEALDQLRTAFLDGRSARTADGRLYECWPLAGLEYERALRVLASSELGEPAPLRAALRALVERRRAFVLEHEVFPPTAGKRWRYWTHELFEKGGRRRLLTAPIDLEEYPQAR